MSGPVCEFCRWTAPDEAALTAHADTCPHRLWWAQTYQPPLSQEEFEATPVLKQLARCPACGHEFAPDELASHEGQCGARRWLSHNFAPAPPRRGPRPPPLVPPEPPSLGPGIGGWLRRVARGVKGPDPRWVRLRATFDRIEAIRDDDTYEVCREALIAVQDVLQAVIARDAPGTRPSGPFAFVVGTAERLASVAGELEAQLDTLQDLAPAKVRREIAYLEDSGREGPELDALRATLWRIDEIESDCAARRVHVREVAASVTALRARFVADDDHSPDESVDLLAERIERLHARLEPTPVPVAPRPDDAPVTLLRPPPDTELAGPPAMSLDAPTWERLVPRGYGFSRVTSIGPYRVTGLLGAGGMGVVYEARAPDGRRVALKTARLEGEPAARDALEQRIRREWRILRGLRHPGCVELLDVGRDQDELFLVLSFVEGVPLSRLLAERRLLPSEVLGLGIALSETLAHLHESGVVHRDLKPDNVLLGRDGRAVIADFGVSRLAGATELTEPGRIVGTPGWVAPEIVLGGEVTPAADQWSLGHVLFSCAAGPTQPALEGSFRERLERGALIDWRRYPAAGEWRGLKGVLARMLDPDPGRRFPGAIDAKIALVELASESGARPPAGVPRG